MLFDVKNTHVLLDVSVLTVNTLALICDVMTCHTWDSNAVPEVKALFILVFYLFTYSFWWFRLFWWFRFGCFRWFRFARFARFGGFVLVVSGFITCPDKLISLN